jgi:hypothetical protein
MQSYTYEPMKHVLQEHQYKTRKNPKEIHWQKEHIYTQMVHSDKNTQKNFMYISL